MMAEQTYSRVRYGPSSTDKQIAQKFYSMVPFSGGHPNPALSGPATRDNTRVFFPHRDLGELRGSLEWINPEGDSHEFNGAESHLFNFGNPSTHLSKQDFRGRTFHLWAGSLPYLLTLRRRLNAKYVPTMAAYPPFIW